MKFRAVKRSGSIALAIAMAVVACGSHGQATPRHPKPAPRHVTPAPAPAPADTVKRLPPMRYGLTRSAAPTLSSPGKDGVPPVLKPEGVYRPVDASKEIGVAL
jgi:hypothetical protein